MAAVAGLTPTFARPVLVSQVTPGAALQGRNPLRAFWSGTAKMELIPSDWFNPS